MIRQDPVSEVQLIARAVVRADEPIRGQLYRPIRVECLPVLRGPRHPADVGDEGRHEVGPEQVRGRDRGVLCP